MSTTLDDLFESYVAPVEALLSHSTGVQYQALLLEPNLAAFDGMMESEMRDFFVDIRKTYTIGILERAHLASVTSLARLARWLSGAIQMRDQGNVLAFSACLRGFLEAAADGYDVMRDLPGVLRRYLPYLYLVLHKPTVVDQVMLSFGEIEEKLIHFAYAARRKDRSMPAIHAAKATTEYIRLLEQDHVPGLLDLYGNLCELTHPAMPSVMAFVTNDERGLTFNAKTDAAVINDLLEKNEDLLGSLVTTSFNAPILCLSLLRRLAMRWPSLPDEFVASIGVFASYLKEAEQGLSLARSGRLGSSDLAALIR